MEGFLASIAQLLTTFGAIPFCSVFEAFFTKFVSLVASSLVVVVEQTVTVLAQVEFAVMTDQGARFLSVGVHALVAIPLTHLREPILL